MLTEKLLSAVSLCVVVGAMSAFSDQAGRWGAGLLDGDFSAELAFVSGRTLAIAHRVGDTIGSYTGDHLLLVVFGLGALVLLGFMLRT